MHVGKKKFVVCLIAAFVAGAAVSGGAAAVALNTGGSDKYAKLEELYEAVEENYYMDADDSKMLDGACKGLIEGLEDPYSAYMTAEEYEAFEASALGEYSGVGIIFTADEDGNYAVVEVVKDSPAEAAGIKPGDFLISVDGKTYDDMDLMAADIRGEAGTTVKIGYISDGEKKEAEITREQIVQHSVEHKMLDDRTGYISISSFIESTYDDFKSALEDIQANNAENLVLDLRNNGGGLVDSSVKIADEFLDEGVVVYVEDKKGNRQEYKAEDGRTEVNTVVLVNENSASASEILAAALQDNDIPIVGQKTFGKGVIQSTVMLDDGSALKLTIMQYYSPEGNKIHEKGITPDYKVKNDKDSETDKQLEKALSLFSQQ